MAFRSKDLMLHVLPGESEPVRLMTCQPLSPLNPPKPPCNPPSCANKSAKPPKDPKPGNGGKKRLLLTTLQQQLRETLAQDR